ncbi:MAG: hypothetical protein M1464_01100 [Candidatus Thermoplasmatota archaeon]|nr:hypothetical protein [Candidatus Thermoplasmatota archaeon]
MSEMKEKSHTLVSSYVLDEDVRALLYNAKKAGKKIENNSREINAYFRAKYGDARLVRKAELVKRRSELKNELIAVDAEIEAIEAQEKIESQIRAKQRIQELSAAWYLKGIILSMKASGKYFDFQNKDRFLPLYEMKLEKIDFQRRALVENIRSHKFPADFEEIILLFNPSWRDPQVQKETEERMLLDPDFVRILEVQQ